MINVQRTERRSGGSLEDKENHGDNAGGKGKRVVSNGRAALSVR